MFSILHITDLHRAKADPISNAELISALISDRDRYVREVPPIAPPQAIVVSGDIIQGVGLDAVDFGRELEVQYDAAYEFLAELAARFVDGDRSKVMIVPGNHDIDWNTAFAAMEILEEKDFPSGLPGILHEPGSQYRWDWKTRRLYVIRDVNAYHQRFAAFWRFFERFYSGVNGLLRVSPWSDANFYSLDGGRIGVAAFNSCAGNDCFAFHGEIPKSVVAQAHLDLQDLGPWQLRIAVWHHDIEGPPHRSDYMDPEIVRGMIGRGFRLGLYGHQHRAQITPQHAYLPNRETMAMISAGSLCAGWRDLPTGARRGYSIIEIADRYDSARVHVREMAFANLFSRAKLAEFGGRSYVNLKWTIPVNSAGGREDPARRRFAATLERAEQALRENNDGEEALRLLGTVDAAANPFGRRLMVAAAQLIGDPAQLVDVIGEPRTIEELVLQTDAHLVMADYSAAKMALERYGTSLGLPDASRADLEGRIELMRRARS
jgi:hypothetical protein